jgi:SnoaL-like domain
LFNAIEAVRPTQMRDTMKEKTMSIHLPTPIERYVHISNSGIAEAAGECFAPDATVYDEGQTYKGLAAIKDWMVATKRKYGHTVAPLELAERSGQSVLKARLAGNFPGSPITVSFSFVLADGKIRSLEIRS